MSEAGDVVVVILWLLFRKRLLYSASLPAYLDMRLKDCKLKSKLKADRRKQLEDMDFSKLSKLQDSSVSQAWCHGSCPAHTHGCFVVELVASRFEINWHKCI